MKKHIAFLSALLLLCACGKKKSSDENTAVPVSVTAAVIKKVPISLSATGTVVPIKTVSIAAQVDGMLKAINIREGQTVKQGDLIMTIDPVPFQQNLEKAQAQLTQDTGDMQFAKLQSERYKELVDKGAAAQADADQTETSYKTALAKVAADKAMVDQAKTDLGYTKITAPFSGKVGSFMVHEGAVIKKSDTTLLVLNMMSPIYVQFSVPEKYLHMPQTKDKDFKLKITATPDGGQPTEGKLAFVDNSVNPDTGMMTMKATFPNTDGTLWPGEFAKVTLSIDSKTDDIVVPANAVQSSQDGKYLFVALPNNTVSQRKVDVARIAGDECVVTGNIAAGDLVVIDGQMLLKDGSAIQIKPVASGK